MLLYVLLTLLLIFGYWNHASKRRMREAVAKLPGPFCFPIIGAAHRFLDLTPENFMARSSHYSAIYGRVIRIWVFNRLVVVSGDVELNEQLLASQEHIVKQRNYRMLQQWLGTGLLLSDGHKWFTRRKIITPTFHFKILEQFVEVFEQQTNIFIRQLAKEAKNDDGDGSGKAFNIHPFVCRAALDIIAETAMGTKVHAQSDASTEYANAVNRLTKIMSWRFMRVHLNNELAFTLFCPHLKWEISKLISVMHEFTIKVIEERRRHLHSNFNEYLEKATAANATRKDDEDDDNEDSVGSKKRMALLDVLLQATIDGKPLSNEDIREEVDTFMFEGHDTTTSALSFAFHLIARHANVQQKLLDEVLRVIGPPNDEENQNAISLSDLSELKYTECVIKETLRMYPSVPLIGRQLMDDFKYTHSKLGDGIIPAGTEFIISIHGMMNHSDNIERPNEFCPERHLSENDKLGAFALTPFSAGPRNCIGQKFAMLEMKTMIAKTVREYEFLPLGEDVIPELNIVLRSSNGCQLGLKKRKF